MLFVSSRHASPRDLSSDSESFSLIILNQGGSCHACYGYSFVSAIHCSLPCGLPSGT